MCGVFGIYYGPDGPEAEDWAPEEILQLMFPAIVHRGHHAWGYMYYDRIRGEIEYYKRAGAASEKKALQQMTVTGDPGWLVGHVRFATKGSPREITNNHPILHGNVIGVHNGVLWNDAQILKETGREHAVTEVDSEAIFAAINKWGSQKGLARIKGDMVAVYTHTNHPRILRLARSYGRPLVWGWTPAGSLVFASESRVLKDAQIDTVAYPFGWYTENSVMRIDLKPGAASISRSVSAYAKPRPISSPPKKQGGSAVSTTNSGYTYGSGFAADIGVVDDFGGTYLGANRWRVAKPNTKDGTIVVSAQEYIRVTVAREVADRMRRIHEAAKRAKDKREADKQAGIVTPATTPQFMPPAQPLAIEAPSTSEAVSV